MNFREPQTPMDLLGQDSEAAPTVLLVEDDLSHARIAQRAFERAEVRCRLLTVGRVQLARQVIAEHSPDLVIADLYLPDGRGTELIPDSSSASYPVIVLTSHGDERAAVESIKFGALDYVVKSAETFLNLPHLVRRSLREWRHIRARRDMEQRLERSERRHRAILDAIPDLILLISREGRILDCRGGTEGFDVDRPDRLIGAGLTEFMPADAVEVLLDTAGDVLQRDEVCTAELDMPLQQRIGHVEARIIPYESNSVLAILRDVSEKQEVAAMLKSLTRREREVLQLVAEGRSNKQMALNLRLSVKTVEAHRARLMRKLGARNMAELMRLALAAEAQLGRLTVNRHAEEAPEEAAEEQEFPHSLNPTHASSS